MSLECLGILNFYTFLTLGLILCKLFDVDSRMHQFLPGCHKPEQMNAFEGKKSCIILDIQLSQVESFVFWYSLENKIRLGLNLFKMTNASRTQGNYSNTEKLYFGLPNPFYSQPGEAQSSQSHHFEFFMR